jgi:hypothetical protein
MQLIPTRFTNKHQPFVGSVALGAMTTPDACLTRVICINFDHHRASHWRFVGQESQQLSVTPAGTAAIGLLLLLGAVGATAPFGAVTNASQLLDADESVGVGTKNLRSESAIGVSNEPSFPARQRHQTADCGTGAFC